METRAYELREGVDPELFGGSISTPDGMSWNVGDALKDGGGVIVTNDDFLKAALDAYEPLKRAVVPATGEPVTLDQTFGDVEGASVDYSSMLKDDLVREATTRGIDLPAGVTKDGIVTLLENADEEGK